MNSVKNNVTLEGSNELLKKVIRFLTRNGNVELDYNAIIPMPEELKQAEASKYTIDMTGSRKKSDRMAHH